MSSRMLVLTATVTIGIAAGVAAISRAQAPADNWKRVDAQMPTGDPERFDNRVRDSMFRAFGGNEASFKSAMVIIDETLSENPDHPEGLVWRGAAQYWKAGEAFRTGDFERGQTLAMAATADLDRALALAPNTIGVLIPRAAVLLSVARGQRDPARMQGMASEAAENFETALTIRQPAFAQLGLHNRGEYLSGLAESWALAGNRGNAEHYLQRILAELPGSPYAERASAKLNNWDDRRPLNCQSCH